MFWPVNQPSRDIVSTCDYYILKLTLNLWANVMLCGCPIRILTWKLLTDKPKPTIQVRRLEVRTLYQLEPNQQYKYNHSQIYIFFTWKIKPRFQLMTCGDHLAYVWLFRYIIFLTLKIGLTSLKWEHISLLLKQFVWSFWAGHLVVS